MNHNDWNHHQNSDVDNMCKSSSSLCDNFLKGIETLLSVSECKFRGTYHWKSLFNQQADNDRNWSICRDESHWTRSFPIKWVSLTCNQRNRRISRVAFVLSSENDQPLHWIDPKAVLDEVLQKKSDAAHRQQKESPIDETREVVEVRAPWEERISWLVNAKRKSNSISKLSPRSLLRYWSTRGKIHEWKKSA